MKISSKLQKTVIWLTGYLNIIAFFLAGGYVFIKTDDDDVKTSAKMSFFLIVFFTALDILRAIIYNILSLADAGYKTIGVMSDIALVIAIIKAVAFVTLYVLDICGIKILPVKNNESKEK